MTNDFQLAQSDVRLIQQGLVMLYEQCAQHRVAFIKQMLPGDSNIDTIIEYYDKRIKSIAALQQKIIGVSK